MLTTADIELFLATLCNNIPEQKRFWRKTFANAVDLKTCHSFRLTDHSKKVLLYAKRKESCVLLFFYVTEEARRKSGAAADDTWQQKKRQHDEDGNILDGTQATVYVFNRGGIHTWLEIRQVHHLKKSISGTWSDEDSNPKNNVKTNIQACNIYIST